MIAATLFKCRRCGIVYFHDEAIRQEDIIFAQIAIHTCEGTTADGHARRGISDMVGFNEASDDAIQEGEQRGH